MKSFKKVALYSLLTIIVVVVGLVTSVFLFKERIIQQFVREANKNLGTPVKIGKIEVSAFQDFPRISIVFHNVYVEDSHPGEYPLLTAKKVSFSLHTMEVWRGRYSIRGLKMEDSETNLRVNKAGVNNYTIVKSSGSGGSVSFDLRNVLLKNTVVSYIDKEAGHDHQYSSASLKANIIATGDNYHIEAEGDVATEQIGIKNSIWFSKKVFDVMAVLDYDDLGKSLTILPSRLMMDKAHFEVSGTYDFKDKNLIDLHSTGKDANIQMLLGLLPNSSVEQIRKYQSKGTVYFEMALKGEISRNRNPHLAVSFGMKDATLYHPDYKSRIEGASFEGSFEAASLSRLSDARLHLKNISASLNGDPFTGNFMLQDFNDPYITANFQGELNAADVKNFYPLEEVQELSGRIKANVALEGKIELLKNKSTAQQVHTEGSIDLKDLSFRLGKEKLKWSGLNGALHFTNNDLAMSDLSGKFENSDFVVNGFFKNIVTFLLFENQPIGIEADLKSDFLDVDQLFALGFGSRERGAYQFSISPNLNLNFTYNVKSMKYRRFHPTSVKGDLLVKGQVAVARGIKLQAMGGTIGLSGIVDAKNPKATDLISSAKLDGISVDSIFYVFEDFQQDFIGHKDLKGLAFAEITLETSLNEALKIFPETLVADVSVTIKNGELNDFGPLQKLNKYLDDEGLARLRFADLKNDIHIENKTIYIPQMEIRSNVTIIQLSGTHTFDQRIDYRIVAPLRNRKKIDPDQAFGAIEDDLKGKSKVYLKIIGTTDKYEVSYDKDAVKKKIVSDLKKEVQELKEAFRLKGKKKKKELELEKDDYFDWEIKH